MIEVSSNKKLIFKGKTYDCIIGKNGISKNKIEGDFKTPAGVFEIKTVFYRADIIEKPFVNNKNIPILKIMPNDGWGDNKDGESYNRWLQIPSANCIDEALFRDDDLYNIIVTINHNEACEIGKGSAIFFHLKTFKNKYTAGCIAVEYNDMLDILSKIESTTRISIRL